MSLPSNADFAFFFPTVIGSILSHLRKLPHIQGLLLSNSIQLYAVLVLGVIFFAGGIRFREQPFNKCACTVY